MRAHLAEHAPSFGKPALSAPGLTTDPPRALRLHVTGWLSAVRSGAALVLPIARP